jgi:hypothetical protein
MNLESFRNTVRKYIHDEDPRLEVMRLYRDKGFVAVDQGELKGYSFDGTIEIDLSFEAYPTYADIEYEINSKDSWKVEKLPICVGKNPVSLVRLPNPAKWYL